MDQETAKIASQLLPALREALGNVPADLVGLFGGDYLRHARMRNWAKLEQRTREIQKERNIDPETVIEASPSVIVPIAAAAANENSDELLEFWARLLAAATDPSKTMMVRKSFIGALREFDPIDAIVFEALCKFEGNAQNYRDGISSYLKINADEVAVSFENLGRLRCVSSGVVGQTYVGESPTFTGFGRQLRRALGL